MSFFRRRHSRSTNSRASQARHGFRNRHLVFDTLEKRNLLSATVVKQDSPENPVYLTNVNGTLFFGVEDAQTGFELWQSNGVASGTQLIKAFPDDKQVTGNRPLANVNGTLYFRAFDAVHGAELWKSDGTASGTELVADIIPGSGGSNPTQLTNVNGTLYFTADHLDYGYELWKSTGTGATLVADILDGNAGSQPSELTVAGNTLFFSAFDGTTGVELWKATANGVTLVADINPQGDSSPTHLAAVGGALYFVAQDATSGRELWRSDGGTAVLVADINQTSARGSSSFPRDLFDADGTLFFTADDTINGQELYRLNSGGGVERLDINPGAGPAFPDGIRYEFATLGDELFFAAAEDGSNVELWRTNGTQAGTQQVKDIHPLVGSFSQGSFPDNLTVVGTTLYFVANDGARGRELWRTDGTTSGTVLDADINPDAPSSSPAGLINVGDTLYFSALAGEAPGRELFRGDFPPRPDLSLNMVDFPDPVLQGDLITYTITIENRGGAVATGVRIISDPLPLDVTLNPSSMSAGFSLDAERRIHFVVGTLGPGATSQLPSLRIEPDLPGRLDLRITATANEADANPDNNQTTRSTQVAVATDLAVVLEAITPTATVGGAFTYALRVRNLGPSASTGGQASFVLPANTDFIEASVTPVTNTAGVVTWAVGALGVDESKTFEITIRPKLRGSITASAIAGILGEAAEADPLSGNNSAALTSEVKEAATMTFIVTSTADSGPGSLRQAILNANANGGTDRIEFNIPGSGVKSIALSTHLPAITSPVVISGYSQPGSSPNSLAEGSNAVLLIELNGGNAGPNANGLEIRADDTTIEGLVINRFAGYGILIYGTDRTTIQGNFIGVNAQGTFALGNELFGVFVANGANNTIGGTSAAHRNIISGNNGNGIVIEASRENLISNNLIGATASGLASLPNNGIGVAMIGESNFNKVQNNVISGNTNAGVLIGDPLDSSPTSGGTANSLWNNRIGTNRDGLPLGNGGAGVIVVAAKNTNIGGTATSEGNEIAYNQGAGVAVVNSTGTNIQRNQMHDNAGLGIDLDADGVTRNDAGDADAGANNRLNYPVLLSALFDAATNRTIVNGFLDTPNVTGALVHLYESDGDPTGFGEGKLFLASIAPQATGAFQFSLIGDQSGKAFTATTRVGNNTSEFARTFRNADYLDSDGDGLPDRWEIEGIDINDDGVIDLDLRSLGAKPDHKDLFIETDYMVDPSSGTSYAPATGALQDVEAAFARAPVPNPDGVNGITLHASAFLDEPVPFIRNIVFTWNSDITRPAGRADDFDDLKNGSNDPANPGNPYGTRDQDGHFGTVADRSSSSRDGRYIIEAKRLVFRYCIFGFAHTTTRGSSGIAEGGFKAGNDFMVTIGQWSDETIRASGGPIESKRVVEAGTFMHELGHTLGLHHGGGDAAQNKPNYLSVMNYNFQFVNKDPNRPLDFSRQALATLDESSLNEPLGIAGPANRSLIFTNGTQEVITAFGPRINWDGSKNPTIDPKPVSQNINGGGGSDQKLTGYDDWANIKYSFLASSDFADGARPEDDEAHDEPTAEQVLASAQNTDFDGDGFSNFIDNAPGIFNPDQLDSNNDGIGDVLATGDFDVAILQFLDEGATVTINDNFVYLLTVANRGNIAAPAVKVANVLGSGVSFVDALSSQGTFSRSGNNPTFDLGTLDAGATATITIEVKAVAPGNVSSTATVSGQQPDPNTANNSGSRSTRILSAGTLQFAAGSVSVAEDGTLTVTVLRSEGSDGAISAKIAVHSGTATAGSDVAVGPIDVSFADGDASPKVVSIPLVNDNAVEGDEVFTIALTELTGDAKLGTTGTATITIDDNDATPPRAPSVAKIEINNGAAQRSKVTNIRVTFDELVTLDSGALELRDKRGRLVAVTTNVTTEEGRTVAELTFKRKGGSLADGRYTLTVRGSQVRDIDGLKLASDRTLVFHRLAGDVNGDGRVTVKEFQQFLKAFNKKRSQRGYEELFDFDGNGRIKSSELKAIIKNLAK